MKKLIIQIPCFNESPSLPHVLKSLPRNISGIDVIEWLIIDDGSDDDTVAVARFYVVDHIVAHSKHCGLAKAFSSGIQYCLSQHADIIVNTDADNQYCSEDIITIIKPILEKKADMVIGSRSILNIESFSKFKKLLQKTGSFIVRKVSSTEVADAPSGFRAFSSEAARQLNVFTGYTYTIETIIQAGLSDLTVISVPINVNPTIRPSRLIKNTFSYVIISFITLIRSYVIYRPFQFFSSLGLATFVSGLILGVRFLFFYYSGHGAGHIQSVILSSLLMAD